MNLNISILLNYNSFIIILILINYYLNFNKFYKFKLIIAKYTKSTQFFLNLITIILSAKFLSFHSLNCEGLTFSQEPLKPYPEAEVLTFSEKIYTYLAKPFFLSDFEYPTSNIQFEVRDYINDLSSEIIQRIKENQITDSDQIKNLILNILIKDPYLDRWVTKTPIVLVDYPNPLNPSGFMISYCKNFFENSCKEQGYPSQSGIIMGHIAACIHLINKAFAHHTDPLHNSNYIESLQIIIPTKYLKYFQNTLLPEKSLFYLSNSIENLTQKIQESTLSFVTNQEIKLKTISTLLDDPLFRRENSTPSEHWNTYTNMIFVCKQKYKQILETEGYVTHKCKILVHLAACIDARRHYGGSLLISTHSEDYLSFIKDMVGPHNLSQFMDEELQILPVSKSENEASPSDLLINILSSKTPDNPGLTTAIQAQNVEPLPHDIHSIKSSPPLLSELPTNITQESITKNTNNLKNQSTCEGMNANLQTSQPPLNLTKHLQEIYNEILDHYIANPNKDLKTITLEILLKDTHLDEWKITDPDVLAKPHKTLSGQMIKVCKMGYKYLKNEGEGDVQERNAMIFPHIAACIHIINIAEVYKNDPFELLNSAYLEKIKCFIDKEDLPYFEKQDFKVIYNKALIQLRKQIAEIPPIEYTKISLPTANPAETTENIPLEIHSIKSSIPLLPETPTKIEVISQEKKIQLAIQQKAKSNSNPENQLFIFTSKIEKDNNEFLVNILKQIKKQIKIQGRKSAPDLNSNDIKNIVIDILKKDNNKFLWLSSNKMDSDSGKSHYMLKSILTKFKKAQTDDNRIDSEILAHIGTVMTLMNKVILMKGDYKSLSLLTDNYEIYKRTMISLVGIEPMSPQAVQEVTTNPVIEPMSHIQNLSLFIFENLSSAAAKANQGNTLDNMKKAILDMLIEDNLKHKWSVTKQSTKIADQMVDHCITVYQINTKPQIRQITSHIGTCIMIINIAAIKGIDPYSLLEKDHYTEIFTSFIKKT